MKKKAILVLFFVTHCFIAQNRDSKEVEVSLTLPEISMIGIKPENSTIVLAIETTPVAGEKGIFVSKTEQNLWLNYTCSISPESTTKNLSAQIISGSVPEGLALLLNISNYSGSGKGQFGMPLTPIELNDFPQVILTNIGGSYTKQGTNQGHQLEYQLKIINYKLLDSEKSNTLTIAYTLTDN